MALAVKKTPRRQFRLTDSENALLVEAASLCGVSVSEFVKVRALPDAEAIVRSHHTIELAPDAYTSFVEALDQAAARPNTAFTSLVSRARPLKHAD